MTVVPSGTFSSVHPVAAVIPEGVEGKRDFGGTVHPCADLVSLEHTTYDPTVAYVF
jgi:hypothetical protein